MSVLVLNLRRIQYALLRLHVRFIQFMLPPRKRPLFSIK